MEKILKFADIHHLSLLTFSKLLPQNFTSFSYNGRMLDFGKIPLFFLVYCVID